MAKYRVQPALEGVEKQTMIKTITILAIAAAAVTLSACSSSKPAASSTTTTTSAVYSK